MKNIYLSIALSFYSIFTLAQITITSNEMPAAGDTARITMAVVNPLINYGATGANYNWSFANLRNNGQDLKSYQSVPSTNFVYALFFSNLPFNPNRANVVEPGTQLPANPLLTIDNPFNFYYRSSAVYKQVGFGAEIANIPLPVAFTQQDIIYNLPLHYADADTSNSSWNIGLPGLGYYGFKQKRINQVDGWGTLTTPHATYNVLRVKTELFGSDTIAVDTLNLNFAINRPKTTQYKWLAINEIVPVMQITTTEILGLEIVTEIFYRDDYNTITPGSLNTAYCAGSAASIPYIATGSFNGPALFQAANVFTVQLSDSTGSFASPVNIGNFTSRISGNIAVTIPANTPAGNGYRIRVVSSSPAITGGDNGFDIQIENAAIASIAAAGPTTFCAGNDVTLQAQTTDPGYVYQWQLNGSSLTGATADSYSASASGNYTLAVSNSCGTVTSNTINVLVNPLPVASITASGALTFCAGDSVLLSTITDPSYTYQWQLNGVDIAGETNADLLAFVSGIYSVDVSNTCGFVTSNTLTIVVNAAPVAGTISSASTSYCQGDSVLLSATLNNGYAYQWQLNGVDINGATASDFYVNAPGDYTFTVTDACGTDVSSIVTITENTLPTALATAGGSTTLCANDLLTLTTSVQPGATYQWQLNGVDIIGETSTSLTVSASGDYSVNVTNGCGTASSNSITVTVNPLPAVPVISLQTDSLVSTAAVSYQWYFNGTLIIGATTDYYIPTLNGDYTVVITDANGCTNVSAIFTMTTVGIQTLSDIPMQLYPNPVIQNLNITMQATAGKQEVELFNAEGMVVLQKTSFGESSIKINMHNLASGMYIVKITNNSGVTVHKIIKK
jgi:hypothetical protein